MDLNLITAALLEKGVLGLMALAMAWAIAILYRGCKDERNELRDAHTSERNEWRAAMDRQYEVIGQHQAQTQEILRQLTGAISENKTRNRD
jgi:hypothetical protein